MQDANVALDKKKQILASLNFKDVADADAEYKKYIKSDYIISGDSVKNEKGGFDVENDDIAPDNLPLYIAEVNGAKKYIIPMTGNGLWGGIWGYIALNDDCNTIYGVYFSHASETPGLGAEIAGDKFQSRFTKETDKDGNVIAKKVFDENGEVLLEVKKGKGKVGAEYHIDAVSGATLTCNGLDDMLKRKLAPYYNYLNNVKVAGEPEDLDDENFAGEDAGEETLGEDIEGAFETEDENVESETGDEQVTEDASVQVNEEI
jgi:Na+-transporting NADH:ubiquinone oxidoreductase subunit C